ncbi:MAG TPA: AAA family ATPase [Rhizobiaceae bacterium]|nr:AAA family ATPase [Rhizobiaceae bacterium]
MAYRKQQTRLKAPYLKRLILELDRVAEKDRYPFNLPLFRDGDFELEFTSAITILVGENGTGKSTLLEAIAGLAGYDEAGGGKGYMPTDHSQALAASGKLLATALRASWLPKVTQGWFFRAESFFTVARYLDDAAREPLGGPPPDYLSWSHGEGFIRFFEERCRRQGIYMLDEPESALSPARQIRFLQILKEASETGFVQIFMATHSPLLMACPNARLLQITRFGLEEIAFEDTEHFRMMRSFCNDPRGFLEETLGP